MVHQFQPPSHTLTKDRDQQVGMTYLSDKFGVEAQALKKCMVSYFSYVILPLMASSTVFIITGLFLLLREGLELASIISIVDEALILILLAHSGQAFSDKVMSAADLLRDYSSKTSDSDVKAQIHYLTHQLEAMRCVEVAGMFSLSHSSLMSQINCSEEINDLTQDDDTPLIKSDPYTGSQIY
nr:uncharacterized protein LOC123758523 [Procambarus clarkii]